MRATHCRRPSRSVISVVFILFSLISVSLPSWDSSLVHAQGTYDPTVQTPTLLHDEARTVYLGNLTRRDHGLPPLRWNRQLTLASRWFSWDSVENRPGGYCGHQDSQGNGFGYRASAFGYLGFANAENAFCGYVTPEAAIAGWMNSPGHRANLLNSFSRELGLGYYRRNSDGRGYVTQVFGNDSVYSPVIIENEAPSTTSANVNLYIYSRPPEEGFAGWDATTQMMVSNNPHFNGAAWEPYNASKVWTLASGEGWRDVYVKTQDRFQRSLSVSDTIYLGASLPLNELSRAQMSATQPQVTLYNLNGGVLPQVHFSLGWLADDTDESFTKWWGNGERVRDAAAWGGTAYRLRPGDGESYAWANDWGFPVKDVPLVAYFRLKVNDNTSSGEVARISVDGGGTEYGPISLRGTDFTTSNQYQEFALRFTFHTNPNNGFLTFNFWRSGNAEVYVDAVSIFSTPQGITSPLVWSVPGGNYRGQGVWVRYTNGSQFSAISEGSTTQEFTLRVSTTGNGTVVSHTAGINCGSDCSETYVNTAFDHLSSVTLTPVPAPGYVFIGWSGDCSGTGTCSLSMATDQAVVAHFTPANWYIVGHDNYAYGATGDAPVVGDYNADGKADVAVFRPSNNTWYIRGMGSFTYGATGDIPVMADYNGDGKADIAVFRPSNSTWYIRGIGPAVYGAVGDMPVVADYNGDGKDDIAVFRPSNSTWYIRGIGPAIYGATGDIPVVADYNGDGKDDIAVFRPSNSTWYIRGIGRSVYGTAGNIPVVADYNGDGKDDIAVFRP